MENIVVRQSVIIKCNLASSVMLGNYEFYYAGGLLCRLAGKLPAQDMQPEELYAFLKPLLEIYEPKNEQEAYLVKLLQGYKIGEKYDEQMQQLLQMGLKEKNMWIRTPAE